MLTKGLMRVLFPKLDLNLGRGHGRGVSTKLLLDSRLQHLHLAISSLWCGKQKVRIKSKGKEEIGEWIPEDKTKLPFQVIWDMCGSGRAGFKNLCSSSPRMHLERTAIYTYHQKTNIDHVSQLGKCLTLHHYSTKNIYHWMVLWNQSLLTDIVTLV